MKKKTKFILAVVGLLVIIQLFRVDKSIPETDPADHFIQINTPPEPIKKMLQQACYDCHSFETKWPWYSNIAPVSWLIGHHVEEGREYFNFSTWGKLSQKKKNHLLEEMVEEVEKKEMPLAGYTLLHPEARLSDDQRAQLMEWFKSL